MPGPFSPMTMSGVVTVSPPIASEPNRYVSPPRFVARTFGADAGSSGPVPREPGGGGGGPTCQVKPGVHPRGNGARPPTAGSSSKVSRKSGTTGRKVGKGPPPVTSISATSRKH